MAIQWMAVLAAAGAIGDTVGGVFSVVGFFQDSSHQRRTLGMLRDIQQHLTQIDNKIENLKTGQREILAKLDQLPVEIHQITKDVVAIALLNERYSRLRYMQNFFLAGNEELTESGRIQLGQDLQYLVDYENRVSYIPAILQWCEFYLIVTKEGGTNLVDILLETKIGYMQDLIDDFTQAVISNINQLHTYLNNKKYVSTHNLTENLETINNLSYSMQGDRQRTEHRVVRICDDISDGCCRPRVHCREIQEPYQVHDQVYSTNRDKHQQLIQKTLKKVSEQLMLLANVNSAQALCKGYKDDLIANKSNEDIPIETVGYGEQEIMEKHAAGELSVEPFFLKRLIDCY